MATAPRLKARRVDWNGFMGISSLGCERLTESLHPIYSLVHLLKHRILLQEWEATFRPPREARYRQNGEIGPVAKLRRREATAPLLRNSTALCSADEILGARS